MEQEYTYSIQLHPGESGETGHWVSVPVLPGCFSRGETYQEAIANAREAIELHLQCLRENGDDIPIEKELPLLTHVTVVIPKTK
jgi:predicted RNase H-like HicB family nuclease